jgi:methylated-DNA-[protein]-cysteine S-methyltransferase
MRHYICEHDTPVGEIVLFTDGEALTGAYLEGKKHFCGLAGNILKDSGKHPVLERAKNWLSAYFAGEKPEIGELQLNPEGSDFRLEVWQSLQNIPYGKLISYGDIAREIAIRKGLARMSAQAVGGAVGHNPLAIIIPCHRVIGHNGNLTGYGGGIAIKIWLLRHEGIDVSRLSMPKNKAFKGKSHR